RSAASKLPSGLPKSSVVTAERLSMQCRPPPVGGTLTASSPRGWNRHPSAGQTARHDDCCDKFRSGCRGPRSKNRPYLDRESEHAAARRAHPEVQADCPCRDRWKSHRQSRCTRRLPVPTRHPCFSLSVRRSKLQPLVGRRASLGRSETPMPDDLVKSCPEKVIAIACMLAHFLPPECPANENKSARAL